MSPLSVVRLEIRWVGLLSIWHYLKSITRHSLPQASPLNWSLYTDQTYSPKVSCRSDLRHSRTGILLLLQKFTELIWCKGKKHTSAGYHRVRDSIKDQKSRRLLYLHKVNFKITISPYCLSRSSAFVGKMLALFWYIKHSCTKYVAIAPSV